MCRYGCLIINGGLLRFRCFAGSSRNRLYSALHFLGSWQYTLFGVVVVVVVNNGANDDDDDIQLTLQQELILKTSYEVLVVIISSLYQDQLKKVQDYKPNLEEIKQSADTLLESGRLDIGDAERVERYKEDLDARYTALNDKLLGSQNK